MSTGIFNDPLGNENGHECVLERIKKTNLIRNHHLWSVTVNKNDVEVWAQKIPNGIDWEPEYVFYTHFESFQLLLGSYVRINRHRL